MESSTKKIKDNQLELEVALNKEDLAGHIKKAEDMLTEGVSMDGFRKGKVPKNLAKEKVGEEAIRELALDNAIRTSLSRVIEKEGLDVVKVSEFKIVKNNADGLTYKVQLTVFPEVTIPNLEIIKVNKKTITVSEDEIRDALESLRTSRASANPKNAPAVDGDRVEINFEVTKEGNVIEGGVSNNHPLVIGSKHFIPGFEEELIGLNKGDEKSFSLTAPADYFQKDLAGKKLDFKVKIVEVQTITKPELNDEFAKSLGRFQDLGELKENLTEGLKQEKATKEQQRARVEVLSQIAEKSNIPAPEDMINGRLDDMISAFDNDLHRKGMELGLYLAHINKTEDDLRKDWRKEAEKQVRFSLIVHSVAKRHNINATEEEVNMLASQKVQMLIMGNQVKEEDIDVEAVKDSARSELVNEKTLNFIEKTCVV